LTPEAIAGLALAATLAVVASADFQPKPLPPPTPACTVNDILAQALAASSKAATDANTAQSQALALQAASLATERAAVESAKSNLPDAAKAIAEARTEAQKAKDGLSRALEQGEKARQEAEILKNQLLELKNRPCPPQKQSSGLVPRPGGALVYGSGQSGNAGPAPVWGGATTQDDCDVTVFDLRSRCYIGLSGAVSRLVPRDSAVPLSGTGEYLLSSLAALAVWRIVGNFYG
jgi:hypothetical protein